MNKWTKTPDGFCSEASDLGLRPGQSITKAVLPNGTSNHRWQTHFSEGDITHWTTVVNNLTYTVFND